MSAKRFLSLITSFDYRNHVLTATHKKGHTLDLILTRSDDKFVSNIDIIDPAISDHSAVNCKPLLAKPSSIRKQVNFRNIKSINFDSFRADIKKSGLLETTSTFNLVDSYENTLSTLLDTYAPIKSKIITLPPATPWYTPEFQEQKIIKRRLERRLRTTRLIVDRELYTQQCVVVNRFISNAKTNYYKEMISDCGSDQGELFKKIERMFKGTVKRKYPPCVSSEQPANKFANVFDNKIDVIRKDLLAKSTNPTCFHVTETIPLPNDAKLESFAPTV